MNEIRIVEMREEDLPVVLKIYNYYVTNTTATFHMHTLSLEEMRMLTFYNNPKFQSFVIKEQETICGYCILEPFNAQREAFGNTGEIAIYLKHDCRSKGIGNKAISFIEQVARKNEIHVLMAVICGENEKSIQLFERNGYEKCGHLKEVGMKFDRVLDLIYYQKIMKNN